MRFSRTFPLLLISLLVFSLAVPTVHASVPAPKASYNPGEASKYHAPISEVGLIAVTRSFRTYSSGLLNTQFSPAASSSSGLPAGLVRFINDSSYTPQTETAVSLDPANPNHVVGAFNDGRWFFCPALKTSDCPGGYTTSITGFTTSSDGGLTVSKSNDLPGITMSEKNLTSGTTAPGFFLSWGDPQVAAAPDGSFFAASLAIDPITGANGIMVLKSSSNLWSSSVACSTPESAPDTNPCWTAKMVLANSTYQCAGAFNCGTTSFEDKETIAVDGDPSSPTFGSVYISWDHFYATGTSSSYLAICNASLTCIMLSGGSVPVLSGSDEFAGFATTVVGPDGKVYLSWCNFGTAFTFGPVDCSIRSSPAGGTAFGGTNAVMSFMGAGTTLPGDSVIAGYATEQFRTAAELTLAAGSPGEVYFAIPLCVAGGYYEFQGTDFLAADNPGNCGSSAIFFTHSTDSGVNWASPAQVSPLGVEIQPALTVDPTNDKVVLAYYSSQFDSFNHRLDVMVATSADKGATFSFIRATSASDEPNSDPALFAYFQQFGGALVVPQFGDYLWASAYGGKVLVLFSANYVEEEGTFQTDPFLAVVGESPTTMALGPNAADAAPGDTVTFQANGLTQGSAFTLTMQWDGTSVSLANGTVSATGEATGSFTVPNLQSQVYSVVAKDSSGIIATSNLGVGQVSLSGVQAQLASLQSGIQSLGTQLQSVISSLGSLNSSIGASLQKSSQSLASQINDVGSSVTSSLSGTSSTLSIIEDLSFLIMVMVAVVLVVQLARGRSKTPGT